MTTRHYVDNAAVRVSAPNAALAAFSAFTVFVAAAYLAIGRHPERLRDLPSAATLYGSAMHFFPIAHIGVGAVTLAIALTTAAGSRWFLSFIVLYAISLASELLGTGVGIPFGTYRYSSLLGPAWDLTLDPAMSYWVWGTSGGAYYGMPLTNLVGWFVTGLALMIALTALRADRWITAVPPQWMAMYFAAVLFLPLAMCVGAGLWIPVVLTGVTLIALAKRIA